MEETNFYQIRVKGHLDQTLASWFEDLKVCNLDNGDALLLGVLQDQAALHGILNRIYSLGLKLVSVNLIPEQPSKDADAQ
jgi:hypothetical protein